MPTPLRAVSFDAAGTLFHVLRPVGAVYAEVAARHGVRVAATDLDARVRHAFGTAPPLAFPEAAAETLRAHERTWWHAVVAEVFRGIPFPDFDAYFADLFATFAAPATWRRDAAALPLLRDVRARGLRVLVISNFDARVRGILDGLELSAWIDAVTISSEAGAAKPDPAIFRHALDAAGLAATEVLHVGDTVREDLAGARAAGLRALLVGGPALRRDAPDAEIVPDLGSVPAWLDRAYPPHLVN